MKNYFATLLALLTATLFLSAQNIPTAPEAEGAQFLGYWSFQEANPALDQGSSDYQGAIQDVSAMEEQDGVQALRPNANEVPADRPHGLVIPKADFQMPVGAFAFEVWFQLDAMADTMKENVFFLCDSKGYFYANENEFGNQGFNLYLIRAKAGIYSLHSWVGFGTESLEACSSGIALAPGEWHRAAMAYDGNGCVAVYLDGKKLKHAILPGAKDIAKSIYDFSIGDRSLSLHRPFTGLITQAALYQGIPQRYAMESAAQTARRRTDFPTYQVLPESPVDEGAEVIGYWNFGVPMEPALDMSQNHWPGSAAPTAVVQEFSPGLFALEPCVDEGDKALPSGILFGSRPDFIPDGAFTFETWFCLDKNANTLDRTQFFLVDKKIYHYATNKPEGNGGYCFYLTRQKKNTYAVDLWLGFGDHSEQISSVNHTLEPDTWHKIAFTYNGKGRVVIYLDGECVTHADLAEKTPLAQNKTALTIGDRSSANYNPFPGMLTQAVLYKGIPKRYSVRPIFEICPGNRVFYRFDKFPTVKLRLSNSTDFPLTQIRFLRDGKPLPEWSMEEMAPSGDKTFEVPVDVTLKPGKYHAEYTAEFQVEGNPYRVTRMLDYDLMPRPAPYMPVTMWNIANDLERLKEIGFTSDMFIVGSHGLVLSTGAPVPPEDNPRFPYEADSLNQRARLGLRNCLWLFPGTYLSDKRKTDPQYARLGRDGKPIPNTNADVSLQCFQDFVANVGKSMALQFGNFSSIDSALIHSEVRDYSAISFRPEEVKAGEAAVGGAIPAIINQKNGVDYRSISDFPMNRVLPEDDPILKFYSWWWKHGDGWNRLHSLLANNLKSTGRDDIWCFFDPAVRTPSIWGCGGDVDILSQWTYSYPDPIKVGEATDELFAMAAGNPKQDVMKMTQVIWYRNQTAPVEAMKAKPESQWTAWEKKIPKAKFVTIAPDHISIAFWSMIARPVKGIMYHGWNSLTGMEDKSPHNYEFTNAETPERLKVLLHSVIKPLGPMLLQVPDRPAKIAMLESFASQIYTACGSWGWSNSWEADMHLMLQWAGYQPQIVYDETIRRDGLDQFDVLVMPNCAILTEKVVERIHDFQKKGGIIVADEKLCPAILPDYVIPQYSRTKKADVDKVALQERAAALRKALDPYIQTPFRTSNMDIVGRMRQFGTSDYLFVMNDKRTYGDYLGQYGLVMEKGLPNEGKVVLDRKSGNVYDLVAGRKVKTSTTEGKLSFGLNFGPGEGKLFLITDTLLEDIAIDAPTEAARGQEFSVAVTVSDKQGQCPDAVIPVQVTVTSPEGEVEGTGYYAAPNGKLSFQLNPATNDAPGTWKITIKNRASGTTASTTVSVK